MISVVEDLKQLFGRRLKFAREHRGYTQKDLGKLVGLDGNTLARIERGEQGVRWNNLERLIRVLEYPANFFFDEGEPLLPDPTPEDCITVLSQFIRDQRPK